LQLNCEIIGKRWFLDPDL